MDNLHEDELKLQPINDLRKYAKRLSVNAGGSKEVIIGRISEARASLLVMDGENCEINCSIPSNISIRNDDMEEDVWTNVLSPKRSAPSPQTNRSSSRRDTEPSIEELGVQGDVQGHQPLYLHHASECVQGVCARVCARGCARGCARECGRWCR